MVHLPQEKLPELGPEAVLPETVVEQHGGIALEPVQHLPGVGIAGDHPGHFQVKALKGGQLQQEPPVGQVQPLINRRLKVAVDLLVGPAHDLLTEPGPGGHILGRDGHPQRIADGLLQDPGDLSVGDRNAAGVEQLPNVLPVEEQVLRAYHRHQPRVLEGHEAAGGAPPGQDHKALARTAANEGAEGLLVLLFLKELKVLHQENFPVLPGLQVRSPGGLALQLPNPASLQQGLGHSGLAEAAGGAKEQYPFILQKFLKFLADFRFYDRLFGHGSTSFPKAGGAFYGLTLS